MLTNDWISLAKRCKAIAVIRAPSVEVGRQMALAVAKAGMELLEVTWNSDRPQELLETLRTELPDCTIGAGTLLTAEDIKLAIAAGAQFLFTPHVDRKLIGLATAQETPIIPGALSPTEIVTAWQAGASSVKVFPIQAVGGIRYLKDLQGPLGGIPLIPTGGITIEDAATFLEAGAIAVGLSSQLFPASAIQFDNWQVIIDRASQLLKLLQVNDSYHNYR